MIFKGFKMLLAWSLENEYLSNEKCLIALK